MKNVRFYYLKLATLFQIKILFFFKQYEVSYHIDCYKFFPKAISEIRLILNKCKFRKKLLKVQIPNV